MLSIKQQAAASAKVTTQNYNPLEEAYHNSAPKSSGKLRENFAEQVTGLLVYLQNPLLNKAEHRQGWQLFESTLRQYLDLKYCEVPV